MKKAYILPGLALFFFGFIVSEIVFYRTIYDVSTPMTVTYGFPTPTPPPQNTRLKNYINAIDEKIRINVLSYLNTNISQTGIVNLQEIHLKTEGVIASINRDGTLPNGPSYRIFYYLAPYSTETTKPEKKNGNFFYVNDEGFRMAKVYMYKGKEKTEVTLDVLKVGDHIQVTDIYDIKNKKISLKVFDILEK